MAAFLFPKEQGFVDLIKILAVDTQTKLTDGAPTTGGPFAMQIIDRGCPFDQGGNSSKPFLTNG